MPVEGGGSPPLVQEFEQVLQWQDAGRYAAESVGSSSDRYLGVGLEQTRLDNQAKREEEAKEKDFSRKRKRDIVWTLIAMSLGISLVGITVFYKSDSPEDRKLGMTAALTALSSIAGFAAGLGLH